MGLNSRTRSIRPPLPAPTESNDEEGGTTSGLDTDVATNITTQTDNTSYEIPEDGQPIKISTGERRAKESSSRRGASDAQSQTSLLIEYFEGARGDKAKPSVRVKVTPSSRKRSGTSERAGPDAIQITGIGKDRKASYTRRISLGSSKAAEVGLGPTEVSHSSDSTVSAGRPLEVEVLDHNGSDLSTLSRGLMYGPNESNVSSMPPDSMLEGSTVSETERGDDEITVKDASYLNAPRATQDRSASRERLAQKVMEKLNAAPLPGKGSRSKSDRNLGKSYDEESYTGAESSLLSSNTGARSFRSSSEISNNPKLLGMVEDTIRRIILPEINAIKKDNQQDRNLRSFESSRRPSLLDDMYAKKGLERSLSKSSSSPNISSKPKVMLSRDGEDPVVLSRGDSERKKMRKSSRGSYTDERPSSRRSSGGRKSSRGYDDGDTIRAKSSKSSTKLKDAAVGGVAGALLTGAALKSLERGDSPDQRKRRSKSRGSRRSGSTGVVEDESYLSKDVPPMPMASHINDSELTRSSLVSDATETPHVQSSTPVREVSRGSLRDVTASPASASSRVQSTTPRGFGTSQANVSVESPKSPYGGLSTKERLAALAAAGVGGAAVAGGAMDSSDRHVDSDGYGNSTPITYRKTSSPMQTVSSLKKTFEEESIKTQEYRPKSAASRSSAGREKGASRTSLRPGSASPTSKLAGSRRESSKSIGESYTEYATPAEESFNRELTLGTPTYGESVDDWYERQHRLNDQYREGNNRDSFAKSSNRDSYQTNPYPQDEKRFTFYSEDGEERSLGDIDAEQDVRGLGANPRFVHTPHGAESAVASLIMEPSNVSSGKSINQTSPTAKAASNSFSARLRELGKDSPPLYQGSTLSQTMPSRDRWQALTGRARDLSASSRDNIAESPRQSPGLSLREAGSKPIMSASGLPLANDPMPEAEYYDDGQSEGGSTNASIVREPLGGDATGKDTWPYTPEPERQTAAGGFGKGAALLGAAAAGAGVLAGANEMRQPTVEDEDDRLTPDVGRRGQYIDREATPTERTASRDEGYVTDARARSVGALTPDAEQKQYSRKDVDEFNRAMDAYGGDRDPFVGGNEHSRNISGNSHGMDSPLFDATTGRGMNGIESKDIVALMDHLTVRDAQRNARDTEILVSLVRSATEMRQSFDEMKRFIVEQDRMIMQNADRSVDQTVQKVLGGPRPQPSSSPRTPALSQEDVQTKRKGVLRRALKGLTSSKSANDLAKVEGMLMQILDNVEDLKHQQSVGGADSSVQRQAFGSPYTNDSLDTYERLRNMPDSGYEPEGLAGTSSTPSQSGQLSLTPRAEKHQFHSGYDGRRGSVNRVSTVLEGDEEDLEPHENLVLDNQFERNEGFSTPTQEMQRARGISPSRTPTQDTPGYGGLAVDEITPRSTEKQRKHKSNSSSVFGIPKVSRWSKTTASSAAPDPAELNSPNLRYQRPSSEASRSGSGLGRYDDEDYELQDDDRLRSTQSLARDRGLEETKSVRSQASKLTRTPSPLIPSEASFKQNQEYEDEPSPIQEDLDNELDDPKYQAHRNSLLLQHPQPRQGTTGRHQNTLEGAAHHYDHEDLTGTNSDVSQRSVSDFDPATWGSAGTAGIARHRLSQIEPMSPQSMNSPGAYGNASRYTRATQDDGDSLIPQTRPAASQQQPRYVPEPEPEQDWEPTYSNSGFSRGGYYSSPFGSGHLLEPIEEVSHFHSYPSLFVET